MLGRPLRNFLEQFKGKLTDEQVATGAHFCFMNAKELFEEANILKEHGKYARALSLAILSLEELGKVIILPSVLSINKNDDSAWAKFWKDFRNHKGKQYAWAWYSQLLEKLGKDDLKDRLMPGMEPMIDKIKQLGLYVDYADTNFIKPANFIRSNPSWLGWILDFAEKRLKIFEPVCGKIEDSKKFIATERKLANKYGNKKYDNLIKQLLIHEFGFSKEEAERTRPFDE